MLTIDLNALELVEETSDREPAESLRYAFPLSSSRGTAATAAVYFELDPGRRLARHTDSAEEVLVVLEGRVEISIGSERSRAGTGTVAVVPPLRPHEIVNSGDGVARVLGVFAASTVVSVFGSADDGTAEAFVVGAPVPIAVPLADAART